MGREKDDDLVPGLGRVLSLKGGGDVLGDGLEKQEERTRLSSRRISLDVNSFFSNADPQAEATTHLDELGLCGPPINHTPLDLLLTPTLLRVLRRVLLQHPCQLVD